MDFFAFIASKTVSIYRRFLIYCNSFSTFHYGLSPISIVLVLSSQGGVVLFLTSIKRSTIPWTKNEFMFVMPATILISLQCNIITLNKKALRTQISISCLVQKKVRIRFMVLSNSFIGITLRVFTSSKTVSMYLHIGTTVYQRLRKY